MARPRTNIRERIVRAARHEFLEHGRGASALRAIARRARTNLGMIYYYFPAKDDLFLAVIEEPYARMVDAIGALLARAEPARDRVRALYRWIGALSTDEVDTFRLVVSEALKSPELRAKVFARAWRGHLPLLFRLVEDARREGVVAAELPTPLVAIAAVAVGVLPQLAARLLPLGLEPGGLAEPLAAILFDGVGPARPGRG